MLRRLWNAMSKFEKGVWISLVAISLFALLPGSLGPFEGVVLLFSAMSWRLIWIGAKQVIRVMRGS